MPLTTQRALADHPEHWLGVTRHIDHQNQRVRAVADAVTAGCATDTGKALALFGFVRQQIRFGFSTGFWDNKASDVLACGVGYCNTKSTLFTALLRASGIPARQVFVDIHASVLEGLLNPGTPYVDHSYVEVFLNNRWIATDAYIVDDALFAPAQRRLRREGQLMGYGVHATGTTQWDGEAPAFAQFNMNDPRPISTRHWGPFEDVADFYRRADEPWNRLNPLLRAAMGLFAAGANRKAQRIREHH